MKTEPIPRKIVIINQASNYLTVGLCNAFKKRFDQVCLITGSIHTQGEELNPAIKVSPTQKLIKRPSSKKFGSYLLACMRIYWLLLIKYRHHEVIFVSLPPMAYLLNLLLPHRFSMVIWDIYPDVFKITGMSEKNWMYQLWAKLNQKSFARAYRLFTISERMADSLSQYVDKKKILVQPIWSIFQANERIPKTENPFVLQNGLNEKFVVQYSGNIGLTHKVELMVELAELMRKHQNIVFQIIGRGPRKFKLQQMVKKKNLPNCTFLPFQSDIMFPYSLSAADLGVVILDELTAKGSVPSKSYNLMSYGIPSLYISSPDSQLQVYVEKFNHGKCFSEKQLEQTADFILELSQDLNKQKLFSENSVKAAEHFKRGNADKFVKKYLNVKRNYLAKETDKPQCFT